MHQLLPHPSSLDQLIFTALFSVDSHTQKEARTDIREQAKHAGIILSPIAPLYAAFAANNVKGFTVPAINMRTLTYDFARCIFKVLSAHAVGACIFEIARSEMEYTEQSYDDIAVSVLAAGLAENYHGPVFLQADHVQVNQKAYTTHPEIELGELKKLLNSAIDAGFYNLDIDASTLVDLEKTELVEQQKYNALITEELTDFLRTIQPAAFPVTIGGEIGHIGDRNSTVADFTAYMTLLTRNGRAHTLSKVSVQTGTSHGGTVNTDGTIAMPALDFSVLERIGTAARESYGMGGAVQHGASTLPSELFSQFPTVKTLEIHLSTGFQNIVFETMPEDLKEEMYHWLDLHRAKDRNPSWSDEQFYYKTRKKALGPFKQELWNLSAGEKQPILQALEAYLTTVFEKLSVFNTRSIVDQYFKDHA